MTIKDKRTNHEYESYEFPVYGKHDFGGNHYGYISITHNYNIIYFYVIDNDILFDDVTEYFEIINKNY